MKNVVVVVFFFFFFWVCVGQLGLVSCILDLIEYYHVSKTCHMATSHRSSAQNASSFYLRRIFFSGFRNMCHVGFEFLKIQCGKRKGAYWFFFFPLNII